MAWRRALIPLGATAVGYASIGIVWAVLALTNDPEWHHEDDLHFGEFALASGLFALVLAAVSLTIFALVAKQLHWLVRVAVPILNLPVLVTAAGAMILSVWGFQNYAAGYAAYDAARQVCGQAPVIVRTGYGAGYILPGDFDYDRIRYASHAHGFLFNNEYIYYCTEAEAIAHGYHHSA